MKSQISQMKHNVVAHVFNCPTTIFRLFHNNFVNSMPISKVVTKIINLIEERQRIELLL